MTTVHRSVLKHRCQRCWQDIAPRQEYVCVDQQRGRRLVRDVKVHYPHCPPKPPKLRFKVSYRVAAGWKDLPSQPSTRQKACQDAQRLLARQEEPVQAVMVKQFPGGRCVFACSREEWENG